MSAFITPLYNRKILRFGFTGVSTGSKCSVMLLLPARENAMKPVK
jgi:hypothetical protein